MDLNDEKEKATFIYKLELRKLIIDKLLVGAIIVLIGISANIILEKYRSNLSQERFLIEKKFEAITKIKASYSDLNNLWGDYTVNVDEVKLPLDHKKKYKQKLDAFMAEINKWNILLPQKFAEQMNYFIWIHGGIEYRGIEAFRSMDRETRIKHRTFMSELAENFIILSREALELEDETNNKIFMLEEMSFSEASDIGSVAYYDMNYNNWTRKKR